MFQEYPAKSTVSEEIAGEEEGSPHARAVSIARVKMISRAAFPDLEDSLFLHVRRTDYLHPAHAVHLVDLDEYYDSKAIALVDERLGRDDWTLVASDDMEYCKAAPLLQKRKKVRYCEDLDEVETHFVMAACGLCGIAANSTFSWWGGYLNAAEDKIVTLPSRWWNLPNYDTSGIYFRRRGSAVVPSSLTCTGMRIY